MTENQQQLAERLIEAHKNNGGIFNGDFTVVFDCEHADRHIIYNALRAREFLTTYVGGGTFLTEKGWAFTTFNDEQIEIARRKRIDDTKEKYDILGKQFIYKTRYVPYGISFLALIISAAAYFKPSADIQVSPLPKPVMIKEATQNEPAHGRGNLSKTDTAKSR